MNDTDDTTEHPLLYQSVYDLPYFQGDFWISEVEKILYELDGYGLPGDTNAAMRYWWKEEKKKKRLQPKNKKSSSNSTLINSSSSSSSSSSTNTSATSSSSSSSSSEWLDTKRRDAWNDLQNVYSATLAAVLPSDKTSSLKQFERNGTPQSHGVGVGGVGGGSGTESSEPITRYNCVRFRLMNDNVSNVLTRRQQDYRYKIELDEKYAKEKLENERLASIPDHIPTFNEREAWLMSNLKTRISPMADQFLIWHLNPTCYACHDVLMGNVGGGKCWLYEATGGTSKKKDKKFLCMKCYKNPKAKGSILAFFSKSVKKSSHHKKISPVTIKQYILPPSSEISDASGSGSGTSSSSSSSKKSSSIKKEYSNNASENRINLPVVPSSSIFDSRMGVLAYAQRMGFQFDQLRRAKHSSMMLLLQLHRCLLEAEKGDQSPRVGAKRKSKK